MDTTESSEGESRGQLGAVCRYVGRLVDGIDGRRCQDRLTGEWYACKTIKKARVNRIET